MSRREGLAWLVLCAAVLAACGPPDHAAFLTEVWTTDCLEFSECRPTDFDDSHASVDECVSGRIVTWDPVCACDTSGHDRGLAAECVADRNAQSSCDNQPMPPSCDAYWEACCAGG
ncbi:MAG: hypothetical protein AB8H79_24765 [Myxococcota bacterium]